LHSAPPRLAAATVLSLLGMCRIVCSRMGAAVLVVLVLGFLVGSQIEPAAWCAAGYVVALVVPVAIARCGWRNALGTTRRRT